MARIPRPKELSFHKATRDLWQGLEVPRKEKPRVRPVPRNIQCRARSLQPNCSLLLREALPFLTESDGRSVRSSVQTHWGSFLMLPEGIPRSSQILPLVAYHVQPWPGCPHLTTAQGSTRFWVAVSHSQMTTRASPPLKGNRAFGMLYPNRPSPLLRARSRWAPKAKDLIGPQTVFLSLDSLQVADPVPQTLLSSLA